MSDKTLRQQLIDELDFDPSIDSAHIGVAVDKGIVTLSGHVRSYAEKVAAERAVARVKGVRAIAQEIEVRYPNASRTSDDQIAERAVNILAWDTQLPDGVIHVRVTKGFVTLTGTVEWQYQRAAAEAAVRRLSGVVGVSNLIELRPQARAVDVRKKILDALKRAAELESSGIEVDVADGKVTLHGRAKTWSERNLIERAAWSAPGVRMVEDRITLS